MDLESTLKEAEYKVWAELEPINNPKADLYAIREEGLTVMALKKLANSNCSQIQSIQMIAPDEEKIKGYDFEICVGSNKKGKFIRFFIQAKKIQKTNIEGNYGEFKSDQCKNLESYSKEKKSIPLYALFNHLENSDRDIIKYYNSSSDFKKEFLGITLVTTSKMKIKGKRKFKDLHETEIPAYFRYPFLRYHPNDIDFYEDSMQAAVPFHELAYFSIENAEAFNKRFKELKRKNSLGFFFFFFDDELFDDGEELIPVLKTNSEELTRDFRERNERNTIKKLAFNSKALIIINQDLNE